jgi:hypothetical protein
MPVHAAFAASETGRLKIKVSVLLTFYEILALHP